MMDWQIRITNLNVETCDASRKKEELRLQVFSSKRRPRINETNTEEDLGLVLSSSIG